MAIAQRISFSILLLFVGTLGLPSVADEVTSVDALLHAVNEGEPGADVVVGEGVFELTAPLRPQAGMTIRGAGPGKTVLRNAESWSVGREGLPDGEVVAGSVNHDAYLIDIVSDQHDVTIRGLTLTGPSLHGAVLAVGAHRLELSDLEIRDFLWSGVRTFFLQEGRIHDNTFIDAGGQAEGDRGITGGAMFLTYTQSTEIWNNRIIKTDDHPGNVFGIKGREIRGSRIHHNTIETNFAIEFPFENDHTTEIDHNVLLGVVSLPKHLGGSQPPEDGQTNFHLHHNYFRTSYAIEGTRNAMLIEYNLFDFDAEQDDGNLISCFGNVGAPGPVWFHNNYVSNPGRGIFWCDGPHGNISIANNHIIARTTATPRLDGLLGFHESTDAEAMATLVVRDNIITCIGQARPLLRNDESSVAAIENNRLANVSDAHRYANPETDATPGPIDAQPFAVGVDGELTVDGFEVSQTAE